MKYLVKMLIVAVLFSTACRPTGPNKGTANKNKPVIKPTEVDKDTLEFIDVVIEQPEEVIEIPVVKDTVSEEVVVEVITPPTPPPAVRPVVVGAARFDQYLHILQGKRVAMVVNQTSSVNGRHLVDVLLSKGVNVKKIFAPEHGFRGKADAGEKVENGKDSRTGLPLLSLYGKNKKPSTTHLSGIDIVIFDIQDVGARFYTYISTMHYVMEACAEQGKEVLVLDRPNPNGHYVDGPVRDKAHKSFVGMHPIPIVHGMTVAELAKMINGEGWLKGGKNCTLTYVACENYSHNRFYELPIKPSPNLPNIRSIYLYPWLCLFEGTTASVGRGTDMPFQIYGHPSYKDGTFRFTPRSKEGAKYPKHKGKSCNGFDLRYLSLKELQNRRTFQLHYVLDFYKNSPNKSTFFLKNKFFDTLVGNSTLRQQIIDGYSESAIRQSWASDIERFKTKRKRYLLYTDFE